MKKVLLGLALVCSLIVNAGTYNWAASKVYASDGLGTSFGEGYIAYLIVGDDTSAAVTALSGKSAADVKTWVTSNADATQTTTVNASGAITSDQVAGTGTHTYYGLIFDGASIDDASKFYVTKTAETITVPGSGNQTASFGAQGNSGTKVAANWHSFGDIPEPTSGLLLVLGGAVLALRRRRA